MNGNKKDKNGFTLMELLIVIAIIVVLVAIAIPVFKGQITKANEAADVADIRNCYAQQQEEILTGDATIASAIAAVQNLDLNYSNKLNCTEDEVIYTTTVLKNNDSNEFKWKFETANIE